MKHGFWFFFAVQFMAYALLCWNIRSVAQAWYLHIVASDLAFAALNFTVIKKVAQADSRWALAGYTLGGATGSLVSVALTQYFLGH